MDKIEKLKQILQVANQDTVSYKQLSELLKVLAKTITDAKNDNKAISDEMKDLFSKSVAYLEDEHRKLTARIESNNDKRIEKIEQENKKVLDKALSALNEIKSIVVVDGIDGKDGADGKDGKDGSPDTREQIVEKINSGKDKDKKIDAKQITGLPEYTKEIVREFNVGHPETPIKGGTGITVTKDASGANVITAIGGTTDEKVKLDASDPTAGYLDSKLQEGVQQVAFDLTPSTTVGAGKIQWNAVDGTFDMGMLNNSILQVGQEMYFYGKADGNIANGEVCEFSGAEGDHIKIKKAVGAEIDANPHYLVGVATQNITNGEFGYATWFGKVNGVYTETPANGDTESWSAGDILYISKTTGQLTKTMPTAPDRVITTAAVIKEQTGAAENGVIIVRPQINPKVSDLSDVDGTPLSASGQILVWNNTAKYWDASDNITNYSKTDEKVKFNDGDPTAGYLSDKTVAGTGINLAEGTGGDENKLIISNTAPFVDAPSDGNTYGRKNGGWSAMVAGLGDMILDAVQSVTGLKTFDKDKFAMKGTSTGKTVLSTANTSANDYTATLPAKDGTIAMTSDIPADTDEKVKYDAGDPTAGYVADKVVAGTGISVAEGTGATENKLVVTSTITQYTDEMAQDAVGNAVGNGLDYDDNTGAISVDETELPLYTTVQGKQIYHGIQTHGALSWNNTTHVLTLASGTNTYWFQGTKYTTANAITCDLDDYVTLGATPTLYYVSFDDASGTLKASADAWDWYANVFVATVFWNGSTGAVQEETHLYNRDIPMHIWAHSTIGTRYASGLNLTAPTTAADSTLQVETGVIWDEDHSFTTGQRTTMRGWYKTSASAYTFADYALPYLGALNDPYWLDTDDYTLKSVADTDYVVYWVYATTDIDRPIYVVPTQASTAHNTITLARAELAPSLTGVNLNAEVKLIYKFIYKGDGQFQEMSDLRTQTSLAGGATTSTSAGSVTFVPAGNVSSTTVQGAIEELDTEKAPITSPTFQTSINGAYLTPSEILITDGSKNIVSAAVATYPSLTELSYIKGLTSAIQSQLNGKQATLTNPVTGTGTANEIAYFTGTGSAIGSLAVATYPSIAELAYVKGVTSAIQTQFTGKVDKSTYDAHTVLYATTDNTPVALTVSEQTVVGRVTGGNISAIAIDSDLSSVSANDDTIPSAKATKAALDLKAPLASPTFSGTVTLGDNTRVNLTLPTANEYCTGPVTASFNAGYSSAVGDLVFFGSGGKWLEVDADAVATCQGLMGIALEAKTDGQAMKVALPNSMVRWDTWNWTVGATLYAGETLGALQETIPTGADAIIKVVGFALNADTIYFNPSQDQQSTIA